MANCEKCGATFTPSAERTEVTSLRVLCQKCEAERRAEKSARATATAPAHAPAQAPVQSSGKPIARASAPAGAPAATRPAASTPVARPSANPAVAARPASTPAPERRAASSPPAPRAPRAARGTAPAKEMHGSPAKKLLHRPVAGKTVEGHDEHFHPDIRREVAMLKQRESKVMTIAWIVCGVLVLTAGAVALTAKNKHDRELAAVQKYRSDLDTFLEQCKKFDLATEDGCKQLLAFTNEKKALGWEDDSKVGGEAAGLVSKAKANQESIADRKQEFERLATIEGVLKDPGSKTPDDLLRARRTLDSLVQKEAAYGDEYKARVISQVKIVDRAVLSRLRDEAKTLAGGGPEKMRAALTAYSKAEDEATRLLDKAMSAKEEETKSFFTTQFKEIFEESNKFVESVFTQDYIDKTPWTDLLSEEQKKHWQNYGLQGFRLEGGKLEAIGPAAGGAANGLIDTPEAGGYRDLDLEMEFTLKGTVDVLFRLGRRVDNTVETYLLSTTSQEPLKVGQTYTLHATYIGNKLTGTLTPGDVTLATFESNWTKSRKGAFGAQIHEGAELRISKLRIRELRNF
jgi:hypothetical protein